MAELPRTVRVAPRKKTAKDLKNDSGPQETRERRSPRDPRGARPHGPPSAQIAAIRVLLRIDRAEEDQAKPPMPSEWLALYPTGDGR